MIKTIVSILFPVLVAILFPRMSNVTNDVNRIGVQLVEFNTTDDCKDTNAMCTEWAHIGECSTNPAYMLTACPKSCRICQSDTQGPVFQLLGMGGRRRMLRSWRLQPVSMELRSVICSPIYSAKGRRVRNPS